ncbi:MAG: hypothetical protein Kow00121_57540 [Elainellaceae cyanobacterium]
MNHWVLSSGAIVSSALAIYGWTQPSTSDLGVDDCQDQAASKSQADQAATNCSDQSIIPSLSDIPELLPFKVQWGGLQTHQLPDRIETIYQDLIEQAQVIADDDRLSEAVTIIAGIPRNSRHYRVAQQLQADWSQTIIYQASDRYQQADFPTAIQLLDTIPTASQLHGRVLELRQQWNRDAALFNQAIAARNTQNWQQVVESLRSLEGSPVYHSPMVQELLQQAISQQFQPDEQLMEMARVGIEELSAPIAPGGSLPGNNLSSITATSDSQAALPIAPMSPSNLLIDTAQAMEWAQPPSSSLSFATPQVEEALVNSVDRAIDLPAAKPTVVPPELVPVLPAQKSPTNNLATAP